ncbi:MAG: hypothetical protein LBU53_06630 [Zoogloeaceae bacterium]|jgi:hypothetical protein|nr:hypothetical protein [Zoogloeaceae bacterium]
MQKGRQDYNLDRRKWKLLPEATLFLVVKGSAEQKKPASFAGNGVGERWKW